MARLCPGSGMPARPDGSCRACSYDGAETRQGLVRNHERRPAARPYLGRCDRCGTPVRVERLHRHTRDLAECPACGSSTVVVTRIRGALRPDVPCDARCTSARGHNCECSCAGANHGRDHEAPA